MRLPGITMGLLLPLILASSLAFAACTPEQQQMLEGILKNVDSINGTITVVDKSGQTHVITIRSNSTVQTQSGASSLEALESGTNVKIRLESRNVAGKIEADLARVSGTISAVNPTAQDITVTPEKGGPPVTVHVTSGTSIRLNSDSTGNFSDLTMNARVDVKYNPDTRAALRVTLGEKENAEIEGKITGVSGNAVTVRTEKDRTLTLTADSTTTIRIRGTTGALADLKTGLKVNAKFDPFTKVATRIVVQTQEEESEDEEEGERKEAETPTNIPHTLQGRTDCLACHQTGAAGGPDVPADHSGRTSATCQGCHQPKRT